MRIVFFCLIISYAFRTYGQIDTLTYLKSTNDFKELLALDSLNDKGESSVASYLRIPIREAPGVISVLTQEDIEKSGARDLRELLMLLPGIDFEVDVQNNLGMGIRGLWGEEGKVLILWDGNIMNETSYGTFSFGQHIYLGNIQRVEMIRGPGSAIYGGLAGLAVINITSKNYADSFTPGYLSQSIGFSQNRLSHQVTQIGVGNKWNNGLSIQATGTLAKANISNRLVADTINYADSSAIDTRQFGIQGNYKNLDFSMLYDGHKVDVVEGLGRTVFTGWYGQLNYQWKLSEKLMLVPTV